jgi:mono/diheme cytochrome c family protein
MKKSLLPVSIIFFAVLLSSCNYSLAGDIKPPPGYTPPVYLPPAATAVAYPLIPPDPAHGETIYSDYCASCHGNLGNGAGKNASNSTTPPAALAQIDVLHNAIPQTWFSIITDGNTNGSMPAFSSKLDDRSRWDVISYLLSLENSPDQMATGGEIFATVCSQCHGETGKGDGEKAATLLVKPTDFTDQRIMSAISNQDMVNVLTNGLGDSMPAFGNMLPENEKWAVITAIRSLSFQPAKEPVISAGTNDNPTGSITLTPQLTTDPSLIVGTPTATPGVKMVNISGKLTIATGLSIPKNLTVSLRIFDQMKETSTLETTADDNGGYSFKNVEMPSGRIFIATVDYGGQQFSSQPSMHPGVTIDESQTAFDLPIPIYDSTTDKTVVSADRMHVFFDFNSPGIVQVVELFLISNNSSQVLISATPDQGVLDFSLPVGAANLQFQDSVIGERYLQTVTGFSDTVPVNPGVATHQVLFAFDLPYTKKLALELPIPMKVDLVNVMVPVDGIKLKSEQLSDGGIQDNQGVKFRLFTGTNLSSGSTLNMTLSGNTPASQSTTDSKIKLNPVLFGAGIFLFALSGVGLYFYQKQKSPMINQNVPGDSTTEDKESIMDAIIVLDNLYKEGKLKEDVYNIRREELKNKLKSLL